MSLCASSGGSSFTGKTSSLAPSNLIGWCRSLERAEGALQRQRRRRRNGQGASGRLNIPFMERASTVSVAIITAPAAAIESGSSSAAIAKRRESCTRRYCAPPSLTSMKPRGAVPARTRFSAPGDSRAAPAALDCRRRGGDDRDAHGAGALHEGDVQPPGGALAVPPAPPLPLKRTFGAFQRPAPPDQVRRGQGARLARERRTPGRGAQAHAALQAALASAAGQDLCYWSRSARGSTAEVDYLVSPQGSIRAVEVKSGPAGKLKSMHLLLSEHPECAPGFVVSAGPYAELPEQGLVFLPLYYAAAVAGRDAAAAAARPSQSPGSATSPLPSASTWPACRAVRSASRSRPSVQPAEASGIASSTPTIPPRLAPMSAAMNTTNGLSDTVLEYTRFCRTLFSNCW